MTEPWITEPGLYPDVTPAQYHADPVVGGSLSSSGARALIPPSCPALFRWQRDHPVHKNIFDFGSAAHRLVLGAGEDIVIIEADNWRSKEAKAERDQARAEHKAPLLAKDYAIVEAMAAAIRAHPTAAALLHPDRGQPEQMLVWRDEPTGVMCRALLDWLPNPDSAGRLIVPDYKTSVSAEPDAFAKSAANYGYHMQADFYLTGLRALGLADDRAAFVFIVQEKTAPFLVTVAQLDDNAMRIGAGRNKWAREVYAYAMVNDHWPAWVEDIAYLPLPAWAERTQGEGIL